MHTGFWWENLKERDGMGDFGVDIEMDRKQIGWVWLYLVEGGAEWRCLVQTAVKLRIQSNMENSLTSWRTNGLSRMSPIHGVCYLLNLSVVGKSIFYSHLTRYVPGSDRRADFVSWIVQTGCGTCVASGASFLTGIASWVWSCLVTSICIKVKNKWSCTSASPICLHGVHTGEQFVLEFYVLLTVPPCIIFCKVLCYKSEGRWFDSRWCHWNFSLT